LASDETFDVRTGRVIPDAPPRTRTAPNADLEDWRDRIERWNEQTVIEKRKKEGRCTIL
jgi:hypothetical protein